MLSIEIDSYFIPYIINTLFKTVHYIYINIYLTTYKRIDVLPIVLLLCFRIVQLGSLPFYFNEYIIIIIIIYLQNYQLIKYFN